MAPLTAAWRLIATGLLPLDLDARVLGQPIGQFPHPLLHCGQIAGDPPGREPHDHSRTTSKSTARAMTWLSVRPLLKPLMYAVSSALSAGHDTIDICNCLLIRSPSFVSATSASDFEARRYRASLPPH